MSINHSSLHLYAEGYRVEQHNKSRIGGVRWWAYGPSGFNGFHDTKGDALKACRKHYEESRK